jgi:hypothetical protein
MREEFNEAGISLAYWKLTHQEQHRISIEMAMNQIRGRRAETYYIDPEKSYRRDLYNNKGEKNGE